MGYYVFRKWYIKDAINKWDAIEKLREAEKNGTASKHFEGEWSKEAESTGWFAGLKKQFGRK